jgi:hypothetical protein
VVGYVPNGSRIAALLVAESNPVTLRRSRQQTRG